MRQNKISTVLCCIDMFKVDPHTLYAMKEIEESLQGIISPVTFLNNLGLRNRRVFKEALWGWEIIEAAKQAQPFSLHPDTSKRNGTRMSAKTTFAERNSEAAGEISPSDV